MGIMQIKNMIPRYKSSKLYYSQTVILGQAIDYISFMENKAKKLLNEIEFSANMINVNKEIIYAHFLSDKLKDISFRKMVIDIINS
ncbi:hypothetical protein A3Q56_01355 [Intoshia linei]|uniref:Uncharacterized protein n=1 Tax=Intoshia linei TaxID=1819745 RepID=A0A177BB71_9BILA|nr:hypothetical protein A3Q56_01355 [Intoshia linei]